MLKVLQSHESRKKMYVLRGVDGGFTRNYFLHFYNNCYHTKKVVLEASVVRIINIVVRGYSWNDKLRKPFPKIFY